MKSSSSSMWQPVGASSSASGAFQNQATSPELTEEELERQYATYKAQFEEWIGKNRDHPDRDAYNRYVNQFKDWEQKVEANRRAIRQWKAARAEKSETQEQQVPTTSKLVTNGGAADSETSSPPPSSTSGKKKKKKSKKKKTRDGGEAVEEDPMMAMMKMMAATMATASCTAAPAPTPAAPMDPFSMMMAMTMMMPMMMNAAPIPPVAPPVDSAPSKPASTLPDVSRPPPGFSASEDEHRSQYHGQMERDRQFRGERSHQQRELGYVPNMDQSSLGFGESARERGKPGAGQATPDDRGDFWYQRWLANRQQPPSIPSAIDRPWYPSRQPKSYPPAHVAAPSAAHSTRLWQPGGPTQRVPVNLDRDTYVPPAEPPFGNRSHFGARDFSMRKQQHQRRWD